MKRILSAACLAVTLIAGSGCAVQRDVVYVTSLPMQPASAVELAELQQECGARIGVAQQEIDAWKARHVGWAVGRVVERATWNAPPTNAVAVVSAIGGVVSLASTISAVGAPPAGQVWAELGALRQDQAMAASTTHELERTRAFFQCARGHAEFATPVQVLSVVAQR